MNWERWSRRGRTGSWHLVGSDSVALCGRRVPASGDDVVVSTMVNGVDPAENEKTCETCLRVSHRDVEKDL